MNREEVNGLPCLEARIRRAGITLIALAIPAGRICSLKAQGWKVWADAGVDCCSSGGAP